MQQHEEARLIKVDSGTVSIPYPPSESSAITCGESKGHQSELRPIRLAISDHFNERDPLRPDAYADLWVNKALSTGELVAHLQAGRAICIAELKSGHCDTSNVTSISIMGLDFDSSSVEALLTFPIIEKHATILYPTARSTPDKPRSRVLFVLDEPLTVPTFKKFIRQLAEQFHGLCDPKALKPAQIFFGSQQLGYIVREDRILTLADLQNLPEIPKSPPTATHETGNDNVQPLLKSQEDLQRIYKSFVQSLGGRQNALFDAACMARDEGWTRDACEAALVAMHVKESPKGPHKYETLEKRRRAAVATIKSVFSRSARSKRRNTVLPGASPTWLLDTLCRNGLIHVARVWLALCMSGWNDDQLFSEKEAVACCNAYGISRDTVRKALLAEMQSIDTATGVIAMMSLFNRRLANDGGITGLSGVTTTSVVRGAKSNNYTMRGRGPTYLYTMPSKISLCSLLGIPPRGPHDILRPETLCSNKKFRVELTLILIRRRPGTYSREWLANRIGVSRWTLSRIVKSAKIRVLPQHDRLPLSKWKAMQLLEGDTKFTDNNGIWLEDETGKQYRPERWRAFHLLNKEHDVFLVRQRPSHYSVMEDDQDPNVSDLQHIS